MNKCPRCNKEKLLDDNIMNSRSHTHNGVIICNDCGTHEALVLNGFGDIEDKTIQIKWENWKA